jgi:transposase InsO family protein
MPWKAVKVEMLRREFVRLAFENQESMSELCRRFGISRKSGYKWIHRYSEEGDGGLADRSRRPFQFCNQSYRQIEEEITSVRHKNPSWGGRKIKAYLEKQKAVKYPAASTVTAILRRNGLLQMPPMREKPVGRFERSAPNELWQMDFKGDVPAKDGRCYPLTVLDDFSRYSILLQACANQESETVKNRLIAAFRLYGMPLQLLVDNGAPWGDDYYDRHTKLTTWLMQLGIQVIHSRPRHPQTLGKDERFHRTLKVELLGNFMPYTLLHCQSRFDDWRIVYNHQRPHEALDMETPASRFIFSNRLYPEKLPKVEYNTSDIVRKVDSCGKISFKGHHLRISKAFSDQLVALRPDPNTDGVYQVFFLNHKIRNIDLSDREK